MKIWIGGILDAGVADAFRLLRNSIEEKINSAIEHVNYGTGLTTWDVILVVSSTPPKEYVRYNKANKETDIRLVVDHQTFLEADSEQRSKALVDTLLNSIRRLSGKKINDFDFMRLESDVAKAFEVNF